MGQKHDEGKQQRQEEASEQQLPAAATTIEDDQATNSSMRTPEKVHKIPKDDSFKTCRAQMPTPGARRQLRATPARHSILSGGQPYKEVHSSGRKFNSRRKGRLQKGATNSNNNTHLNDTTSSNETFIRHERDLMYDRDSLDTDLSLQKQQHATTRNQPQPILEKSLDIIDDTTRPVTALRSSSPRKPSPKKAPPKRQSPKKSSPIKRQSTTARAATRPVPKPRPIPMPSSTPMPMAAPRWNRYMSSTAKKPTGASANQFKKPSSAMDSSRSSVASSRRCLAQWNTPRLGSTMSRTQSFRSTAELERDYISSLRSSRS